MNEFNDFERAPGKRREPRGCVRHRLRPGPVTDKSVKDLSDSFYERKIEPTYQQNREVIRRNSEWLEVYADIYGSSLIFIETATEFDNNTVVSKQDVYAADLYVNRNTGEIRAMALSAEEEADFFIKNKYTAKLTLEVLVTRDEYVPSRPGSQAFEFYIHGPENPKTGLPFDLGMIVAPRATENLISTMRVSNGLTA